MITKLGISFTEGHDTKSVSGDFLDLLMDDRRSLS